MKYILHVDATALDEFGSFDEAMIWIDKQPDPVVFNIQLGTGKWHDMEIAKIDLGVMSEDAFNAL